MALEIAEAIEACRALLATLSVCTTGSTTLAQTSTGYSRASGSFITDGFRVGMEVTPSGFTDTTRRAITAIAPDGLSMTVGTGLTPQTSGSGRTLSVGRPEYLAVPNKDFTPAQVSNRPYIEDAFLPGPTNVEGVGSYATMVHEPIYIIKWWGLANKADTDLSKCASAVLSLFSPRTAITMDTGDILRVRERPGPFASQITNPQPGRALVTITIPLWLRTANSI